MDLERFVHAQDKVWPTVLGELSGGRKQSHWMWFVFPQHVALGRSATARRFGIAGLVEARAYLAHAVLGPRLKEAILAAMHAGEPDPELLFGQVDALKFRSSMTLFKEAAPGCVADQSPYTAALARFYNGRPDPVTLELLQS